MIASTQTVPEPRVVARVLARSQRLEAATARAIAASANPDALLSIDVVSILIGAGTTFIYDRMREVDADKKFPQPIRLSARCSRWRAGDVFAWLARQQRAAGGVEADAQQVSQQAHAKKASDAAKARRATAVAK